MRPQPITAIFTIFTPYLSVNLENISVIWKIHEKNTMFFAWFPVLCTFVVVGERLEKHCCVVTMSNQNNMHKNADDKKKRVAKKRWLFLINVRKSNLC